MEQKGLGTTDEEKLAEAKIIWDIAVREAVERALEDAGSSRSQH